MTVQVKSGGFVFEVKGADRSRDGVLTLKRIMLVEDEESLRDCVAEFLQKSGYEVHCATGDTAIAAFEQCSGIDLLITDVIMPGINGVALAQRILKELPGLPIIFISGYLEESIIERYPDLPNSVFLQKPFTFNTLESAIAKSNTRIKAR